MRQGLRKCGPEARRIAGRPGEAARALRQLEDVIKNGGNIMPPSIEAAKAGAAVAHIHVRNPATGKGDSVYYKTLEDGRKVRIFKSNGEAVDI